MPSRFQSKIDWWLFILLIFLPLQSVGVLIYLYNQGDPNAWVGWIGVFIVGGIYGGLLFPFYYELEDDALLVRFGLVRLRIPYTDMTLVEPTRNIISSPALSLDRLHVHSKTDLGAIISPKDKRAFLDALVQRAVHLERSGDRLIMKS